MIPSVKPVHTQNHLQESIRKFVKGELNENIITKFESEFANKVKSKYAISFPYGRAGLFTFLKSQHIIKSNIILPAYQCLVVPNVVLESGNNPIFVDNAKNQVNMDVEKLFKKIDNKTRAVIATHMHGYSTDIDHIRDILPENIFLIEDSCLGVFSTFKKKHTGNKGDISFYSFNNTKQITTNDGGMVVTNNEEIAKKLTETRNSLFKQPSSFYLLKQLLKTYMTNHVYSNSRLFDLVYFMWLHFSFVKKITKPVDINEQAQPSDFFLGFNPIKAHLGLLQLTELQSTIKRRKDIGKRYYESIQRVNNINYQEFDEGSTYGHFPVWSKNKFKIKNELVKNGIATGHSFDYSCPHTPIYEKLCNTKNYTESKKIADGIFNLPMYSGLTDDKIEFICDNFERVCKSIN